MGDAKINIIGQRFGRWTVLEPSNSRWGKGAFWLCRCDCGTEHVVNGYALRSGRSLSCGCLQREVASQKSKHNLCDTPLYYAWKNMKLRCYRKGNRDYYLYGGRGITVCDEWKNDFRSFATWAMSNGYKDGLSIDRIDVNGNYEPSNCRWVTMKEQAKNKRTNHYLTFKGETLCLMDWSKKFGINYGTLLGRLKTGWSIEKTLTTKVKHPRKKVDQNA